jgi:integrase
VKLIFKWGVTKGIVPEYVPLRLAALAGLRKGKTQARESNRVKVVDKSKALAVVQHVSPQVGAMIKLQLLTGMRSTEVCIMRPCDIDRTGKPWVYRPQFHKTEHHDIPREIPLGPKARKVIRPYLKNRDRQTYLFRPAEADAHRRKELRESRQSNVQPSQVLRSQLAKRRKKTRKPAERYDHKTYRRAVEYGCILAFKMPDELKYRRQDKPEERRQRSKLRSAWMRANAWHPHQARHTAATELRRHSDIETAQIVLGHTSRKTTEIYAEADVTKSRKVMEAVG